MKKLIFCWWRPLIFFFSIREIKSRVGDNEESEKVHYGTKDDDIMKGFDFGVNMLAGYKFKKGLLATVNYNVGVNNLSNRNGTGAETLTSNYFAIKVGYIFNLFNKKTL